MVFKWTYHNTPIAMEYTAHYSLLERVLTPVHHSYEDTTRFIWPFLNRQSICLDICAYFFSSNNFCFLL